MKRFILPILTLASALPPALAIIGGKTVTEGQVPYVVEITNSQSSDETICGGMLISEEAVLTAAHCVWNTDPNLLSIRVGSLTSNTGELIPIHSIIYHPEYEGNTLLNDIAILHLTQSTNPGTFAPLTSNEANPASAHWVTLVGWGGTGSQNPSTELQAVDTVVGPLDVCAYYYGDVISPQHICTYVPRGGSTERDAGGPVIDEVGVVVGIITSGTDPRGDPNDAISQFHTRVSFFTEWIGGQVAGVNITQ